MALSTEQWQGDLILPTAIQQDQIARDLIPVKKQLDIIESLGSQEVGQITETIGPTTGPGSAGCRGVGGRGVSFRGW